MAVVDVGPQWQRIGLDARDFKYWSDSPTRDRRGGAGDQLQFHQARRINFQLAFSHLSAVTPGEHTFWIADVGTSLHPLQNLVADLPDSSKSLETIFPRYKVYSVDDSVRVVPASHPSAPAVAEWPATSRLVCGIPRTTGRGFLKEQKWRYCPCSKRDEQGRSRGNPAGYR
jgi:hypothetical protein